MKGETGDWELATPNKSCGASCACARETESSEGPCQKDEKQVPAVEEVRANKLHVRVYGSRILGSCAICRLPFASCDHSSFKAVF